MPKRYLLALLIIAVVFFGLIGLGIRALTGGSDKPKDQQNTQQAKPRDFIKETKNVGYTVQGKLVGEEERRSVRISVTSTERKVEILQGYDETVIKSQTFANKQAAYDTFLLALDNAGFDVYNKDVNKDERGSCPLGKRYIFTANFADQSTYRSWGASCGKTGSFGGNNGLVRSLFEDQIPEFNKFMRGTRLS